MWPLKGWAQHIEREADSRFAEFMERFLAYERVDAIAEQSLRAFVRGLDAGNIGRLRRLAAETAAVLPAFGAMVDWYDGWRRRVGFYPDGGGGPRLQGMSRTECRALRVEMEANRERLALLREQARHRYGWRAWGQERQVGAGGR